jgi:tryptophan synthase alpha subunit
MNEIDDHFTKLRREKQKALMPFVTAGELGLKFTAAMIGELVAG